MDAGSLPRLIPGTRRALTQAHMYDTRASKCDADRLADSKDDDDDAWFFLL